MIATEREKPKPLVFATCCPECHSDQTRVVRTMQITRYCKCSACGATWKQSPVSTRRKPDAP